MERIVLDCPGRRLREEHVSRLITRLQIAYSAERLAGAVLVGTVVGLAAGRRLPLEVAGLVGWDAAAITMLLWVWLSIGRFDAERTRQRATREDNNRVTIWIVLLAASVASVLGAGVALLGDQSMSQRQRSALLGACLVSVFLAWAVVQTVFVLRYAHEYYSAPVGGIDFGDEPPDYQDFAYFSITVGMTFQTSDAGVTSRTIRRTVLRHGVLAYLFGTVILAVMVNVIASLVG